MPSVWGRDPRASLLTRHFLRRFVDNDLISPHADRHEVLTAVVTGFISSGIFVSVFLSVKFLFDAFQTPGRTSLLVLDDRTFFLSCSMTLLALVAVAQWDALSLDARDASILGPLPVPRGLLVRAKFAALVLFAAGFDLGASVLPSFAHPALVAAKLEITISGALRLMLAQVIANLAAGAFGFLAVLALRDGMRALLGQEYFRRVSAMLQASLVMVLVTLFLLAPALSSRVPVQWLGSAPLQLPRDVDAGPGAAAARGRAPADAVARDGETDRNARSYPPLWFLGLQDVLAADVIDSLPRSTSGIPPRIRYVEDQATANYRRLRPRLVELSGIASSALAAIAMFAVAAFFWNSRKLPAPVVARRSARGAGMRHALRLDRPLHAAARIFGGRHPTSRAGFFFSVRALWRSPSHRVTLMASAAVGIAVGAVMLSSAEARGAASTDPASIEPGVVDLNVLAIQFMMIVTVLFGFRHALRVPAELRANWSLQLAWPGDERPYLTGVRRAAFVGLGLPLLAILTPLHVVMLGPRVAAMHFVFGAVVTLVGLELTTLGLRKPPFASNYATVANLKAIAPLVAPAAFAIVYTLARLERVAFQSARSMVTLLAVFVLMWMGLRVLDARQREKQRAAGEPIVWDELPPAFQRMDLNG